MRAHVHIHNIGIFVSQCFGMYMKFTRFLLAKTKRVRRYSSCHRFLTLSIPAALTFAFATAKVQQKNDIRKKYVIFFKNIFIFFKKSLLGGDFEVFL